MSPSHPSFLAQRGHRIHPGGAPGREQRSQQRHDGEAAVHPAEQGLGSVVGLLALGSRYGIKGDSVETVAWVGEDGQGRRARIPKIYFLRDRLDELV